MKWMNVMAASDSLNPKRSIRFKDTYGIFVLNADNVQFRTGSLSGPACVVSDSERRGLLASVIEKLLASQGMPSRPWNESEAALLAEVIPELQQQGIVEVDDEQLPSAGSQTASHLALQKPFADARVAVVGHGVLGKAVVALLTATPCRSITVIESSSVTKATNESHHIAPEPQVASPAHKVSIRSLSHPTDAVQWVHAIRDHDWIVAAQDCFEPEELAALNHAALQIQLPWSLVCFDGYEGWIGPTFVPGQTACFGCFRRRLFANATEPKHVFMEPGVKIHRIPSPWSVGSESAAWVSLVTSLFALELVGVAEGRGFTLNHILVVHRLNLTFQRESVLRLPRCPDCSTSGSGPQVNVFSHLLSTRRSR
jgi:bacteriocin biosynthesis cyclodehydratase domain-containing protein